MPQRLVGSCASRCLHLKVHQGAFKVDHGDGTGRVFKKGKTLFVGNVDDQGNIHCILLKEQSSISARGHRDSTWIHKLCGCRSVAGRLNGILWLCRSSLDWRLKRAVRVRSVHSMLGCLGGNISLRLSPYSPEPFPATKVDVWVGTGDRSGLLCIDWEVSYAPCGW